AAGSARGRGDICYLPWCRCDGEALWVPPPGLRGSLPPSVGRCQEGQQTRKAQSGLLTLEARQPSPPPKGVHPFIHPKIAVARNGHHVVTTSFGLTPLHPARPLACNERLRRDERDGVGWRASASRYESEGQGRTTAGARRRKPHVPVASRLQIVRQHEVQTRRAARRS